MRFLLYGAYGYTGKLMVKMAKDFGLTPVLAGRNEAKLKEVADEAGYEYIVLDLTDTAKLEDTLQDFTVVLHAAGPFKFTAKPMMDACLKTKTHYLDITGEIAVFELGASKDENAQSAGIMVMPGVGFDVVPTDCTAAYLKNKMPDAVDLKLAFAPMGGGVSHGTALTMAEGLGEPSARRIDGEIIAVPLGEHAMTVPFMGKDIFVMSIPWGDVSTAYHTTGILNIETFTRANPKTHKGLKYQKYFGWILRSNFVKDRMRKKIKSRPAGPSDERRASGRMVIWGQATNAAGEQTIARLTTPEGYTLTAFMGLNITKKVLEGNFKPGFQTPAGCYGADLVFEMDGVTRDDGE